MKFIRPELKVETPVGFTSAGHIASTMTVVQPRLVDPKLTGGVATDAIELLTSDPIGDDSALAKATLVAAINRVKKIYLGVYIIDLGNASSFEARIEFKDPDRDRNIWIPSLEQSPGTPDRSEGAGEHTTSLLAAGNYILETRVEPGHFDFFRVVFWAPAADDDTTEIYLSFFTDGLRSLIPDDADDA